MTWSEAKSKLLTGILFPADDEISEASGFQQNGVLIIGDKGIIPQYHDCSSPLQPKTFTSSDGT